MVFGFGKAKHPEISAKELDSLLCAGEALVVDVREPSEWNGELGHLSDARLVPLDDLRTRIDEIARYPGHDIGRHAGRSEHAPPHLGVVAGNGLAHAGHVRHERRALGGGDRERSRRLPTLARGRAVC